MNKTFQAIPTALALAAALLMAPAAHAGRSCEQRPLTPQTLMQGLALAQQTAQALDAEFARSGARVVVLGRAGQDLGKYQLRYSHLGWAYKTAEGPWRVLHKLNQCGTATGSIYRQGLGEFFLDDLWRHEAVWSVPAPQLQAPLYALLNDRGRSLRLHYAQSSGEGSFTGVQAIDTPLGHRDRRGEGIPALLQKFESAARGQLPGRKVEQILSLTGDTSRFEATPIHRFLDLFTL